MQHTLKKNLWKTQCKDGTEIKTIKNIETKPYDGKGDHILITCNRGTEGYSAEKKNATEYAIETIEEIRKYSKRPIIVRFHRALSGTQQNDFETLSKYISDKQGHYNTIKSKR